MVLVAGGFTDIQQIEARNPENILQCTKEFSGQMSIETLFSHEQFRADRMVLPSFTLPSLQVFSHLNGSPVQLTSQRERERGTRRKTHFFLLRHDLKVAHINVHILLPQTWPHSLFSYIRCLKVWSLIWSAMCPAMNFIIV